MAQNLVCKDLFFYQILGGGAQASCPLPPPLRHVPGSCNNGVSTNTRMFYYNWHLHTVL